MSETTRRAVLAGAAGVSAATVLAACGSDNNSGGGDLYGGGSQPTTGGGQPTGAAPTTGGGNTGGNTGGQALAKTSDIPVGGGKIFADQKVVVTQPKKGTFKGFDTTCKHAGCPVSTVANGTINCPCHGSKYSVEDGSVKNGPATKPLDPKSIKVQGDSITLA
jgi:nitrite reductase/ring-hydroxylating ferredoxin subunit